MKPDSEPFSLSSSTLTTGRSTIGRVCEKSWNSRPIIRPLPRTSLMMVGYLAFSCLQAFEQIVAGRPRRCRSGPRHKAR